MNVIFVLILLGLVWYSHSELICPLLQRTCREAKHSLESVDKDSSNFSMKNVHFSVHDFPVLLCIQIKM
jgi:hypothetical protein